MKLRHGLLADRRKDGWHRMRARKETTETIRQAEAVRYTELVIRRRVIEAEIRIDPKTETATRVFRSIAEAAEHIARNFAPPPAGALFE